MKSRREQIEDMAWEMITTPHTELNRLKKMAEWADANPDDHAYQKKIQTLVWSEAKLKNHLAIAVEALEKMKYASTSHVMVNWAEQALAKIQGEK